MNNFLSSYLLFSIFILYCNSKSIPKGYYHSDVIVTNWPTTSETSLDISKQEVSPSQNQNVDGSSNEPGWMKKQLLKFGQVASKIGNAMGSHANKISAALDKICEVVKTVIPLLAAVCHVGQFGFCSATDDAPIKLSEAMNLNDLDLNSLDR